MVKSVKVNAECKIARGPLEGQTGKIIAANFLLDEVRVGFEDESEYITTFDNVKQD